MHGNASVMYVFVRVVLVCRETFVAICGSVELFRGVS